MRELISERRRIGAKRERIVIQSSVETADAEGEPIDVWSTFATVWARVEFLSGRELEAMQKINAEASVKFTTNYIKSMAEWNKDTDPDMSPLEMRIRWRNSTWNIHAIQPTEDKFDMALMCSKVE